MASYVADHIPVICPSGLLRSTNSFPMNLSLHAQRKVTKRKGTPISLPFGSPHHSPLPTGRPDSPSGLDMTKSDVHVGFALPKPNGSANFVGRAPLPSSSPKTASLIGSIDHGRSIESCRARMASQDDPLAVKMAEGMRSTSARDVFFGLRFLHEQKR